jgi:hypothetical protein
MSHVYKKNTWKTCAKRRGIQVVQRKKSTKKLPRRGRRSGKGEEIRRKYPLHISANILETIAIIATLIATPRKNARKYIHS